MIVLEEFIFEYQSVLRLAVFVLLLGTLLTLEHVWPRRAIQTGSNRNRRLSNIVLLGINIIALRICVPLAAFEVALFAGANGLGLFNQLALPWLINVLLSVVLFDLLIYLQHLAFHYFKPLWKIHRIHHTDLQFDVTTGVRFHPLEIILSMLYKMLAILVVGPAAVAVILYEVLLNAAALFTHSNVRLKQPVDSWLRRILVTPDMHRVHHSVLKQETDTNYGNIFSFWDRLFRTYQAQPREGHEQMQIGLLEYRDASQLQVMDLMKLPFHKTANNP